ncbi:MAG: hypothetical protein N2044_08575 [Cyclobacteriaceae bacterium]|nr:hypothetical protein [Cyclobacteriaceae bacterium]MCX7637883.1 hypothetical protein [Cyclobacteriaceae bacterium]
MMAGGGFLKQMNDTIRYNLDLKKNLRRKPEKNTSIPKTEQLTDHQSLSEKDRKDLLATLKRSQREEQKKINRSYGFPYHHGNSVSVIRFFS